MSLDSLFSTAAGTVGAVISGGATGIIGVAVQRVADYFNQKQKNEADIAKYAHELAMRKQDAEIMQLEAANRITIATIDANSQEHANDTQALIASYAMEPQRYTEPAKLSGPQLWVFTILDCVRGLVRPGLTAYLAVLSSLIYWQAVKLISREGMTLDPERAFDLVNESMNTVLYLFTCCTLWYFGSRNRASEAQFRKTGKT